MRTKRPIIVLSTVATPMLGVLVAKHGVRGRALEGT